MKEHKQTLLAKEKKCSVNRCTCGTFNLTYHFTTVHLSFDSLLRVLEIAYNHESKGNLNKSKQPLKISFGTSALFILPEDFNSFYKVIEDATSKEMNIGNLVYNKSNQIKN